MAFVWITGYTRLLGGMHMAKTDAQRRAHVNDIKNNVVQVVVRLRKRGDSDIIQWLESRENKTGYIKSLIREDMKANGKVFGDEQDGV